MSRSIRDHLFDALAAAACVLALVAALRTVHGLEWPYDGDHYRDVAQAQIARDGHPLSDPFYAGEWIWYNPLVPWLVAAGSAAFRMTPSAFHVRGGPWLNLLAPIGFYLLCRRLAGAPAAFAALVIFLFFNCRTDPALTSATYSSWLFVATFAQGLFFLTALVMVDAGDRGGRQNYVRAAAIGFLAGLTFLAHTAPALILGAIAIVLLRPRSLAIAGIVALLVASPFVYSILVHYHLHVVNDAPMAWRWLPVTIGGFPSTLSSNAVLIGAGVAGAFILRQRAVSAWLAVSLILMAAGMARDVWPSLPAIVPAFHFWRYAMAALTLLAGVTAWWVCQKASPRYATAVLVVAASVAVGWYWPRYRSRFDFVYGEGIARQRDPHHSAVTAFLHKSVPADAVVVGSRGASLEIIGPAGRHVVAVNPTWSNPYIDNAGRVRDRDAMLEALRTHNHERIRVLAGAYDVTHVVGVGAEECGAMAGPELQLLYAFGDVCVSRLATLRE